MFDMLKHLILPLIIIGMASAGATIRVLRGNLLDELKKQYVITARAKGLTEGSCSSNIPCAWRSTRCSAPSAGCCRPSLPARC